jgi:hypothetical protein
VGGAEPDIIDWTYVDVEGTSRYDSFAEADGGFVNGKASYKVFFPNGVQFTDTIDFPSSK